MKREKGYPLPLGVSEKNENVNFSIVVEKGKKCCLCLYEKGNEASAFEIELPESDAIGEVRFVSFSAKELEDMEYNYNIEGDYVLDPYVKSISRNNRGKIKTSAYEWDGDSPLQLPLEEIVAYSLHVRGFTKHGSSNVKHKGTFAGIVEKIPYLKDLGVNQIQCMPVYAFDENTDYKNYWGYGEAFCFAIKQEYSSQPNPETELKDMVKACHKAGIEVVLNLPFTEKTPKQLIWECLQYYVLEFHIDGFILNGYNAPLEQLRENPILRHTKLLENKDDFQNVMRCYLKGDEDMVASVMCWLEKSSKESGGCNYITNHTGFTLHDLVSYNEKHNEANGEENKDGPDWNLSWNCGEEGPTQKKYVLDLRKKQMRNAMFLLLMAKGTPCILAGDEFGNTQGGNNNVYCQDNEIAWLDWNKLEKEAEFIKYIKQLIKMRKAYPMIWGGANAKVSYHGEYAWKMQTDRYSRQLGIYYQGEDGTELFFAYNMHYAAQKMALPTLKDKKEWHLVLSTAANVTEDVVCERQILVNPRTILVFEGR